MKIKLFLAVIVTFIAMSFSISKNHWELLGSREVNYALDHDEILVTRLEGTFTAIKIAVKRSPINMQKMVVHYGNGDKEEIALRENFGKNSESRVIDLPGNKRVIRSVEFWYDTRNLANDKGVVELWGRH